jgi:hypothetical protein
MTTLISAYDHVFALCTDGRKYPKEKVGVSCSKDIESSENEQICEKIEYNDENFALDCSPLISRSQRIFPHEFQAKSFSF